MLSRNRAVIWGLNDISGGQFKRGDLIEEIFNQWDNKYATYENLNNVVTNYPTLDFDGVLTGSAEVVSLKTFKPISNNTLNNFKSTLRSNVKKLNDDANIAAEHAGKSRVLDFVIEKGAWAEDELDEINEYVYNLLQTPEFSKVNEVRISEF